MNLKKLTQAVFQGLPSEYRWAAVDANAKAFAYTDDPEHDEEFGIFGHFSCADRAGADYIEIGRGYDATDWQNSLIERLDVPTADKPESITDVARSIEAARVAEKSERTYPHYFKDVSGVDAIDLYHVARLYDITNPALFHAFKKIACAGRRGAKDQAQDVQEAIDALQRWQELNV